MTSPDNIRRLARFIYDPDWASVRGAYIHPLKVFASDRPLDPNEYLEVIRVVDVDGTDVAITRGGGLFLRATEPTSLDDVEVLSGTLNLLLCELAFAGLGSQPVTDIDVQPAKLIGRHASITGGFGDFAERTWGPYSLLASGPQMMGPGNPYWPVNFYWTTHDQTVLDLLNGVPKARTLAELSSTLPALLVAATYHAARHNVAESILASWIVTEQICLASGTTM